MAARSNDTLTLQLTSQQASDSNILNDISTYEANVSSYDNDNYFYLSSLNIYVTGIEDIQIETGHVNLGE